MRRASLCPQRFLRDSSLAGSDADEASFLRLKKTVEGVSQVANKIFLLLTQLNFLLYLLNLKTMVFYVDEV